MKTIFCVHNLKPRLRWKLCLLNIFFYTRCICTPDLPLILTIYCWESEKTRDKTVNLDLKKNIVKKRFCTKGIYLFPIKICWSKNNLGDPSRPYFETDIIWRYFQSARLPHVILPLLSPPAAKRLNYLVAVYNRHQIRFEKSNGKALKLQQQFVLRFHCFEHSREADPLLKLDEGK